jgi:hypothetical protein
MSFEQGDLIRTKMGESGIVIRIDGGIHSHQGSITTPIFVWHGIRNYSWYAKSDLQKVDKLQKLELENLLEVMRIELLERSEMWFDNLTHVILCHRYYELKRELETY